jgi:hypothetical protein
MEENNDNTDNSICVDQRREMAMTITAAAADDDGGER